MLRLTILTAAAIAMGLGCGTPAAAQEALSSRPLELAFPTTELAFPVRDLVVRVEDLGGAAQDLQVQESETEIRIELAADVLFDFDQADLRPEAQEALKRVAAILREYPEQGVWVEGHTDAKGSEAYNQRLSERRAAAVRDWLATEEGLTSTKFVVQGFGESRPAAPNAKPDGSDDPEGRQRNRRVEIVVEKD